MDLASTKKRFTNIVKRWKQLPLTTANLTIILLGLFSITLGTAFYFVNQVPSTNEFIENRRIEIIKSLLQVLVVTIIGGTVAALFSAHERNQEQTKIRIRMKLDFIKRIGELYRIVKRSRRLLRSRGILMNNVNETKELDNDQIKFYHEQMLQLNDVQLEIEGYKIGLAGSLIFENCEQIVTYLARMENYLNKIIGQFEDEYQSLEKNKKIHFKELNFLWEFTAKSDNQLLKNEPIKYSAFESDKEKEVYYCFKKIFSLSYGAILSNTRYLYFLFPSPRTHNNRLSCGDISNSQLLINDQNQLHEKNHINRRFCAADRFFAIFLQRHATGKTGTVI